MAVAITRLEFPEHGQSGAFRYRLQRACPLQDAHATVEKALPPKAE